jgi:uncharacterized protein (DUF934 family)
MALIRNGALVEGDPWRFFAEGEALPAGGAALVTAKRWAAERERLLGRNAPIGVKLEAGDQPAAIAADLDRFGLVAVDFPKFNDGRGYSAARLLRERHGYKGEIRAVGRVLRDQLLFMLRCGFDGFDLADKDPVGAWAEAVGAISVFYRPAGDDRAPARRLRHAGPRLARAS